jgi:hypothetical protein
MMMCSSMIFLAAASSTSGTRLILRLGYAKTSSTAIRRRTQRRAMSHEEAPVSLGLRLRHYASEQSVSGLPASTPKIESATLFAITLAAQYSPAMVAAGWLSKATSLSIEVGLREPDASAAVVRESGAGRNDEDHIEYRCCSLPSSGYHLVLARDQCAPWKFHDRTDSVGGLWRHRHCSRHYFVVGS